MRLQTQPRNAAQQHSPTEPPKQHERQVQLLERYCQEEVWIGCVLLVLDLMLISVFLNCVIRCNTVSPKIYFAVSPYRTFIVSSLSAHLAFVCRFRFVFTPCQSSSLLPSQLSQEQAQLRSHPFRFPVAEQHQRHQCARTPSGFGEESASLWQWFDLLYHLRRIWCWFGPPGACESGAEHWLTGLVPHAQEYAVECTGIVIPCTLKRVNP